MKVFLKKLLLISVTISVFNCSLSDETDKTQVKERSVNSRSVYNRPPVPTPPKNMDGTEIPLERVPQFVTFAFDDNGYSDGVLWAVDMMSGRTNPAGTGNPGTYDGTKATVTFYNCSYYGSNWISESPTHVKRAWRAAYDGGHEIGNHTSTHGHGNNYSINQWGSDIDECTRFLSQPFDPNESIQSPDSTKGIGIPAELITGFRSPYLEYNDELFKAVKERNMYDCSIEEGFQYDQDGTNFLWPYTLDNGSPGHDIQVEWGLKEPIQAHPGLWEMPVYVVIVPPELRQTMKSRVSWFDTTSGKITGFDYNLWVLFKMTKAEYLATLKHTLDLRLQGNRAPFMLGAHTDYYSTKYSTPGATVMERREAMQEFMDYAQSKSVVRVVSVDKILDWIKEPKHGNVITHMVIPTAGMGGVIQPSTPQAVVDGASIAFEIIPDIGYSIDTLRVNGVSVMPIDNKYIFENVTESQVIEVDFKTCGCPYYTAASSAVNGTITPSQTVHFGSEVTFEFNPLSTDYVFDKLLVDGVPVEVTGNTYTIKSIMADMTIEAVFKSINPGLTGEFIYSTDWGTGYTANLVVSNSSAIPTDGWTVEIIFQGDEEITSCWGGTFIQVGKVATITNLSWNGVIPPGGSVTAGMNIKYLHSATSFPPTVIIK